MFCSVIFHSGSSFEHHTIYCVTIFTEIYLKVINLLIIFDNKNVNLVVTCQFSKFSNYDIQCHKNQVHSGLRPRLSNFEVS